MRKLISTILVLVILPAMLCAQKVGLVMSGGGARGLAHIGVIKVLEENNIPIDYVAGTSMGAIVAALYSMGYTPDEMIQVMKSDDFQRWYTGSLDQDYMYYFKKNKDVPDLFSVHFSFKDSIRVVPQFSNIVNAKQNTSIDNPIPRFLYKNNSNFRAFSSLIFFSSIADPVPFL